MLPAALRGRGDGRTRAAAGAGAGPASGGVRRVGAAGRRDRAQPGGSLRSRGARRARRARRSWRELERRRSLGPALGGGAGLGWGPPPPLLQLARRRLSARLGASPCAALRLAGSPECVTARRGSRGGLRPVRPGGRGCHRPRARLAPLPLSSRLSPGSPPPSVSLYPPPPKPPSACITCRHPTHWESLPCLSPRFRSNKDTWLPSSVRPSRSHRLRGGGVHHSSDQTTGPHPERLPLARGGGGWGADGSVRRGEEGILLGKA